MKRRINWFNGFVLLMYVVVVIVSCFIVYGVFDYLDWVKHWPKP